MTKEDLEFYKGKKVLITGHTGFKGSWLCQILIKAGAEVTGYSLEPPTVPSLFDEAGIAGKINHIVGDIRDREKLMQVFEEVQPEIVFHLAAQPIVRESYKDPVGTYETNVMGTVNICEAVRQNSSVKSFLNVTTDKVYKNNEWCWGYREDEPLDGYDPYSNSKSCSELVTHSYINSFYCDMDVAVSTARAGNVIGGGDFAPDRIIPDCVRAAEKADGNGVIIVRNPYSTRPYQHVLEPLNIYLTIAKEQYEDKSKAGFYNVGPDDADCVTTGDIVTKFCEKWNSVGDENRFATVSWENRHDGGPHEANFLKLDCSLIKQVFGWRPVWNIDKAIEMVVKFSQNRILNPDGVSEEMDTEIAEFFG
ncbi:CDP-glucose 4,6-dehydratase [Lachnospiraceae bacterium NE2001]|nr:CDP-glucose 4,6-dehydratase [Lachnospiraceae bacterium NE2001]